MRYDSGQIGGYGCLNGSVVGFNACSNGGPHVFILVPRASIDDLIALALGMHFPHGTENSLIVKLEQAKDQLQAGDVGGARISLGAFLNEVSAQAGKEISPEQAQEIQDLAAEAGRRSVVRESARPVQ
jgi:hypothetical protein